MKFGENNLFRGISELEEKQRNSSRRPRSFVRTRTNALALIAMIPVLNDAKTDEEREKMTKLLASGFTDSFRYKYPDARDIYSWWSYRFRARENNAGWRIDYYLVSDDAKEKIVDAKILTDVYGSDHCPVELDIEI